MEISGEFNKDLHNIFIDFHQAYDRVKLWEAAEIL